MTPPGRVTPNLAQRSLVLPKHHKVSIDSSAVIAFACMKHLAIDKSANQVHCLAHGLALPCMALPCPA